MENIVVLVVALAIGWVLRRSGVIKSGGSESLNAVLINVLLPALILHHLHGIEFNRTFLAAIAMPYILFGLGCVAFVFVGRRVGLSSTDIACLCLTAAIGNSGFVGLPLVEALIGPDGMAAATALDQLGSTIGISLCGVVVANIATATKTDFRGQLLRIAKFPPVIATAIAIAMNSVEYPQAVSNVFERFAACVAPLALLVVGLQLKLRPSQGDHKALLIGLGFKLIVAPMVVLGAIAMGSNGPVGVTERVMVLDAAMGTTIAGALLATKHDLNPNLSAAMVSYSIPLGIVGAIFWMYLA